MSNDIKLLIDLTNYLNNNISIINTITSCDKHKFATNNELIAVSIGLISQIKQCGVNLNDDLCFINNTLYEAFGFIISYSESLFDKRKLVNTYKLYDCIKVDVTNLLNLLNNLNKN